MSFSAERNGGFGGDGAGFFAVNPLARGAAGAGAAAAGDGGPALREKIAGAVVVSYGELSAINATYDSNFREFLIGISGGAHVSGDVGRAYNRVAFGADAANTFWARVGVDPRWEDNNQLFFHYDSLKEIRSDLIAIAREAGDEDLLAGILRATVDCATDAEVRTQLIGLLAGKESSAVMAGVRAVIGVASYPDKLRLILTRLKSPSKGIQPEDGAYNPGIVTYLGHDGEWKEAVMPAFCGRLIERANQQELEYKTALSQEDKNGLRALAMNAVDSAALRTLTDQEQNRVNLQMPSFLRSIEMLRPQSVAARSTAVVLEAAGALRAERTNHTAEVFRQAAEIQRLEAENAALRAAQSADAGKPDPTT